jgi:hypothetical protein
MDTEKLVFNGVNGATGDYGLPPQTCEELAQHIAGGAGRAPGRQEKLDRLDRDSAPKIAAIASFLAESNFEDVTRDEAWHGQWIARLARTLATELLDDTYAAPHQLKMLERRLSQHTVEKIEAIVSALVEGKAARLAELLLRDQDEPSDDHRAMLQIQSVRDGMRQLRHIQDELLAERRAADLEGHAAAQRDWLEALITALYLVPTGALGSLKGIQGPLAVLIKETDALARDRAPSQWLEDLRAATS